MSRDEPCELVPVELRIALAREAVAAVELLARHKAREDDRAPTRWPDVVGPSPPPKT